MRKTSKNPGTIPATAGEENDSFIREHPTLGRKNAIGSHDSLCWYCDNALGGCSWSMDFEPVDGWDARHTAKYNAYRVFNCPRFVRG